MTFFQFLKKLLPFTKPFNNIIFYTLLLTFIGSFTAQVNAFILKYTVDSTSDLMMAKQPLHEGFYLLIVISIILLAKEVVYSLIQFGQELFGKNSESSMVEDGTYDFLYNLRSAYFAIFNAMVNSLNIRKIKESLD